ncbi:hypothetical protein HC028_06010 [Planosporangium flavigriseum]|uniref:Uncharacterized protein n=1 Tax=Planosporangium flavigriseum TaxID=373681 RepID=A0A8J3PLK7_9ACTN|nr:hypothetical protein [Planosporangium flavigriseum]NJC64067.1 hypothetical protein [Planosporangium flavigriseum]GIG72948.1 hypothetical protein Pfl04_13520 [Planosporangium flavigriseum]
MGARDADERGRASRAVSRPAVVLPGFALVSLVGGLFPSFSVGANVVVLVAGGALFWLGLSGRDSTSGPLRRVSPPRMSAAAGWWLLPVLVLTAVELTNLALGSTHDHPTLSGLADPLIEGYPARVAAYFGWLAAYWGLARL